MDIDQILARIQWREIVDNENVPTGRGEVSTSRLLQFLTPLHTRKKIGESHQIRTEWLGHQSTRSGSDTFRVEQQNLEEIALMIVAAAKKRALIKTLSADEPF